MNRNVLAQDATLKWTSVKTSKLPANRVYSSLAIDPKNPTIVYLGVQGFGTGHLFKTDNGGSDWDDVTPSLTSAGQQVRIDSPVNAIAIDPDHSATVYIATDIGVFVTSDEGSHWYIHGVGLPRTAVLELKITPDRKLLAATHGRGAWVVDLLTN